MKPIQYEVRVANGDWSPYFGLFIMEPQKFWIWDTDDCWDASTYKGTIELQCNYLLKNNLFSPAAVAFFTTNGYLDAQGSMRTSERYSEILSGNLDNGGTAAEAESLFQTYGCIPWTMLNYDDNQASKWGTKASFNADYFNRLAVTPAMIALGKQFLNYVNIAYQRIGIQYTTPAEEILQAALMQAPLQYGIAINSNPALWNQINVPAPDNNNMSHEVTGYALNANGTKPIIDNYPPFQKNLASNYPLLGVVQGIVTAIPDQPSPIVQNAVKDSFWTKVMGWFNNIFYPGDQVGQVKPKGI